MIICKTVCYPSHIVHIQGYAVADFSRCVSPVSRGGLMRVLMRAPLILPPPLSHTRTHRRNVGDTTDARSRLLQLQRDGDACSTLSRRKAHA